MFNLKIVKKATKKSKEAIFKKYGVANIIDVYGAKEKSRKTKELKGYNVPKELLTPFQLYKKECVNITRKNKKELFEKWDGYDFYDNDYIKENLKLKFHDGLYPTIDHKFSMLYGFLNNIPTYIIGDLENLCITKRKINAKKHEMNEQEFKIFLKDAM